MATPFWFFEFQVERETVMTVYICLRLDGLFWPNSINWWLERKGFHGWVWILRYFFFMLNGVELLIKWLYVSINEIRWLELFSICFFFYLIFFILFTSYEKFNINQYIYKKKSMEDPTSSSFGQKEERENYLLIISL